MTQPKPMSSGIPAWLWKLGPSMLAAVPVLALVQGADALLSPRHVMGLAGILSLLTGALQYALSRVISMKLAAFFAALTLLMIWSPNLLISGALTLIALWILVRLPQHAEILPTFAGVFALILGVPALVIQVPTAWADLRHPAATPFPLATRTGQPLPNIYWILLDGFGREDILIEMFGKPTPLADGLRSRGFQVAPRAKANYSQTILAMGSIWNANRIEEVLVLPEDSANRHPIRRAISDNPVIATLRAAGYRIVTNRLEISALTLPVDDYLDSPPTLTELEYAVLRMTALATVDTWVAEESTASIYRLRRWRLQGAFQALATLPRPEMPSLVLTHVVTPHPPFLLLEDGTPRHFDRPHVFSDGHHWLNHHADATPETYRDGYIHMATWTAHQTLEALDHLISIDPDAIFVVHSDHGPGSSLNWDNPSAEGLRERMAILNAIRLPGSHSKSWPPDLTPIDAMRIVLNHIFDTQMAIGDQAATFSTWDRPFRFIDVDEVLEASSPPADSPTPGELPQ